MVLSDDSSTIFSLVQNRASQPERVGQVEELMDRHLGRPVLAIRGTVSANNYVDYGNLQLSNPFLYLQMSLMKSNVATLHIELITTENLPFRITISTLHKEPRYLVRQLRLPLPTAVSGTNSWIIVSLNINDIFDKYCNANISNSSKLIMKYIKRIQLCSNMLVRDVITTKSPIDFEIGLKTPKLPKELAVKLNADIDLFVYDITTHFHDALTPAGSPETVGNSKKNNKHSFIASAMPQLMHKVHDLIF
jgi:hypothetical protein